MNKRKKYGFLILSCVLVAVLSFGISYAFLIDKAYRSNSFTVGETVIEVTEEFSPPDELIPGDAFVKKPWITNTGNLPAFIRAQIAFSNLSAQDFCELDLNTADWNDGGDGYYYYKSLLQPGEKTKPLFTTVTIKENKQDGSSYEKADMISFELNVYAEAVGHNSHFGTACTADEYQTAWAHYQR